MATIALTLLAVFIASVHGDGTCKIADCKCSFSSIEILTKYIDERIVAATIDKAIAKAMNTTINAVSSESAMWTPVDKTIIGPGRITLEDGTTYSFQIPSVIPLTAREFMVYAIVKCGWVPLERSSIESEVIFYVMHNGLRFEKFLYMYSLEQGAWNTNSDNMWFPMPADRLIHIEITVSISSRCPVLFYVIGYR
jgi:hypothetical protein